MAVTQYIGARYVPLFADPPEWTSERTYEPLTIVMHQGNSFTSKQAVPIGIDINDERFWAITGNYNAQVEAYRREVVELHRSVDANAQAIADEGVIRAEADTALGERIDAEALARDAAIETAAAEVRDELRGSLSHSLAPLTAHPLNDVYNQTTNPYGYWVAQSADYISSGLWAESLPDGWVRVRRSNTGTSTLNCYIRPFSLGYVPNGADVTFLVELRNINLMPTTGGLYTQQDPTVQIWGSQEYDGFYIGNSAIAAGSPTAQEYRRNARTDGVPSHQTSGTRLANINWTIPAGTAIDAELRISLYLGKDYLGPYVPFAYDDTTRIRTTESGVRALTTDTAALAERMTAAEEELSGLDAIRRRVAIGSFYANPTYEGSFTAYSGWLRDNANTTGTLPFYSQGMCVGNNGNIVFATVNNGYTAADIYTANPTANTVGVSHQNVAGVSHANCLEYDQERDLYYVITGESGYAVSVRRASDWGEVTRFSFPGSTSGFGAILYDKATGEWWGVSNTKIYTFNPATNTLTDTGRVFPDRANQGYALYDNMLVAMYDGGADANDRDYALDCYDIRDGSLICTFNLPVASAYYPLGELEDISFDANGMLYLSSMLRYESSLNYCATTVLHSIDIFRGKESTGKTNNYTQPPFVFVECANYTGFYSNGTSQYPLKSLDELTHMLSIGYMTRVVKLGIESAHSTTGYQKWFGFIQLTGVNCTLHWPSNENIEVRGGIFSRDNSIIKCRNRIRLVAWCHQTNQAFIRADDSIFLGQALSVFLPGEFSNQSTYTGCFDTPGTAMVRLTSVTKPNDLAVMKTSPNGGYGVQIAAPLTV